MSADLSVGQVVLYVPALSHWNDVGPNKEPLFELLDAKTGLPSTVLQHGIGRDDKGRLHDYKGQTLKIGKPLYFWKATIAEIHPDGSADLTVEHPRGDHILGYESVPHSDGQENHTWHLGA